MKKAFSFLLCVVILIASLSFAVAEEKKVITVFHYNVEAILQKGLDEIEAAYCALHPDVEFKNICYNQGTDYWPQLTTALASGDQPQIIMGNPSLYPELISEGYILDLSDNEVIKSMNIDPSDLASASSGGIVYGFPIDWKTWGMLYNVDMFKELNLEVPTTQTELLALEQAIIAAGYDPYVEAFADLVTGSVNTRTGIWKFAMEAGDKDFMVKIAAGELKFGDVDYFRKALEGFEARLRNSKPRSDDMSNTSDMALEVFATGGALMMHTGSWNIGELMNKNPNFTVGFFPTPVDDSGYNPIPLMVDTCCMVNQKAENYDVAVNFMEFWMQEGAAWSETTQQPLLSGYVSDSLNQVVKDLCAVKSSGQTVSSGFFTDFYPTAIVTIGREETVAFAENILHGDGTMTADDVLNSAQERVDAWLELQ